MPYQRHSRRESSIGTTSIRYTQAKYVWKRQCARRLHGVVRNRKLKGGVRRVRSVNCSRSNEKIWSLTSKRSWDGSMGMRQCRFNRSIHRKDAKEEIYIVRNDNDWPSDRMVWDRRGRQRKFWDDFKNSWFNVASQISATQRNRVRQWQRIQVAIQRIH